MIFLNSIYNRFKSFSLWLLQLFRFWTSSSNYHGFWPLVLFLHSLPRNKIKPWCDEPLTFFPSRHSLSSQEYRESGREGSKQWTECFISEHLFSQELSLTLFPKCLSTYSGHSSSKIGEHPPPTASPSLCYTEIEHFLRYPLLIWDSSCLRMHVLEAPLSPEMVLESTCHVGISPAP